MGIKTLDKEPVKHTETDFISVIKTMKMFK